MDSCNLVDYFLFLMLPTDFFKKNILLFCVSTPTYLKYEVRALMCLLC